MKEYFGCVQIIGYIGLIFSVIAFQCKKHRNVMIFKTANELIFCIQYILLGAYTGAAMNLVGSARNLIFARTVAKGRSTKGWQALFAVFFTVFGLFTWQGPISIMIIAAKVITTIAYGIENTTLVRLLTLPTSICWLIYNGWSGSVGGVLCEAFTIASILVAMLRIDLPRLRASRANRGEDHV